MAKLRISNLSVELGSKRHPVSAVRDVSITVPDGGFMVLLGPSGCGKSTVLNAVAGLVKPSGDSSITIDDQSLYDGKAGVNLPPNRRALGMVFQAYALWPHMSVFDNVAFPLRRQGLKGRAVGDRVKDVLDLVRCGDYAKRYPAELSGGQQQRVALARALAPAPRLLLLDEPLSNLDAELRRDLRSELARLHAQLQFTALYVTHDHAEAFGLASTLAVMSQGEITQSGTPPEVYEEPASIEVVRFFGGNVRRVDVNGGVELTPLGPLRFERAGRYAIGAYPSRLRLRPAADGPFEIGYRHFVGSHWDYGIMTDADDAFVRVHAPEEQVLAVGDRVHVLARQGQVFAFDDSGSPITATQVEPGSDADRREPVLLREAR